jgi:hypothetical protein
MNIAHTVMGRDLERLAREGGGFTPDSRINPQNKVDADFLVKNGMTQSAVAERDRTWAEQAREDDAISDLTGEPPADACDETEIINGITKTRATLNTDGLTQERVRLALYYGQLAKLRSELESFEAKQKELNEIISSPVEVSFAARNALRRTAKFLLGRSERSAEDEAEGLATKTAIAEHRAAAAKLALAQLEQEIERARLRVTYWDRREPDFLNPALMEMADPLGALYLHQIEKLKATAELLFGLASLIRTYGDGFEAIEPIKFPRVPSIAGTNDNALTIAARGDSAPWRQIIDALRLDPRANVDALILTPLP